MVPKLNVAEARNINIENVISTNLRKNYNRPTHSTKRIQLLSGLIDWGDRIFHLLQSFFYFRPNGKIKAKNVHYQNDFSFFTLFTKPHFTFRFLSLRVSLFGRDIREHIYIQEKRHRLVDRSYITVIYYRWCTDMARDELDLYWWNYNWQRERWGHFGIQRGISRGRDSESVENNELY